jgi:Flp pilus assembly pilin Flp
LRNSSVNCTIGEARDAEFAMRCVTNVRSGCATRRGPAIPASTAGDAAGLTSISHARALADARTSAGRAMSAVPPTPLEGRMKQVLELARRLLREEDGIAVTEYGMLIAIVAVGLLVVVKTFRTNLQNWFTNTTSQFFSDAAK